jgi:hypothetical protein
MVCWQEQTLPNSLRQLSGRIQNLQNRISRFGIVAEPVLKILPAA